MRCRDAIRPQGGCVDKYQTQYGDMEISGNPDLIGIAVINLQPTGA
jgi:hypothetical protein